MAIGFASMIICFVVKFIDFAIESVDIVLSYTTSLYIISVQN